LGVVTPGEEEETYVALGRLSTKQSLGQDVPASSGESNGISGV